MFAGRSCRNCPVFDIQRGIYKYPRQKRKNRYFTILLNVVVCLFVQSVCLLVPYFQMFYLFAIEKRKSLEPDLILWIIGSHGCTEVCDSRAGDTPIWKGQRCQEPITRNLQLPHIPVTAFSQTDLFLVWIYLDFRSPQKPQWSIAVTSTDKCWHVDVMSTCSREAALFYPFRSVLM